MDGCSRYHSKLRFITALAVTMLLGLATAYADKPVVSGVTLKEWKAAQSNELAATMQVTFPTIVYDRAENIFSEVFNKIPQWFPSLKLNTIGRGMHSTLTYLDGLTLEGAKEVITFLKGLDTATLEQYDLLKEVRVFDAANPEFVVFGTKSKFIGLKPHREYIEWQMRFYKLLADKAPKILEKHLSHRNMGTKAISPEAVHISLVQWGESYGVNLTDAQVKDLMSKMKELFKSEVEALKAKTGRSPEVLFSMKTHPIELVTAPTSIQSGPTAIVTLKADASGRPNVSDVARWEIESPDGESGRSVKKFIELYTEKFLAGEERPFDEHVEEESWIKKAREFESEHLDSFKTRLRPEIKRVFEIALKTLSPTKFPASVPAKQTLRQSQFYVTTLTHPNLAPEKGFEALETARGLQLHSTGDVSIGVGLYASTVRKEVKNPGDLDMVVNSVTHVPDSIATIEAAEAYAIRKFVKVTIGQLVELARKGTISFTELRLGSDATMGIAIDDVITGLEENPYLSEEDILNGRFKDKKGRVWTLEELVALGDFMKGKVDLFTKHGRVDISLQFLAGYEWKGSIYTFQRNGIKGIPPLVRTAVYDGAESYAIAASLARVYDYYNVQKGSITARAIRDVMKGGFGYSKNADGSLPAPIEAEPLWNSKFIKKAYNYLILLNRSGLGLDEIFFKETKAILERQGRWVPDYSIDHLVEHVVRAINQPALKTINTLKRNVNDLREYNERGHHFRPDQWLERVKETRELIQALESEIIQGRVKTTAEFEKAAREFKALFEKAARMETPEASIKYLSQSRLFHTLHHFEEMLTVLDGKLVGNSDSYAGLTAADKAFVKTLVAYSPHFLVRYLMARSQDAEAKVKWTLRLMGIQPTKSNVETMKALSLNIDSMSHAEIAASQRKLFKKPTCLELMLEREAI